VRRWKASHHGRHDRRRLHYDYGSFEEVFLGVADRALTATAGVQSNFLGKSAATSSPATTQRFLQQLVPVVEPERQYTRPTSKAVWLPEGSNEMDKCDVNFASASDQEGQGVVQLLAPPVLTVNSRCSR
jgi:hypothetical protein